MKTITWDTARAFPTDEYPDVQTALRDRALIQVQTTCGLINLAYVGPFEKLPEIIPEGELTPDQFVCNPVPWGLRGKSGGYFVAWAEREGEALTSGFSPHSYSDAIFFCMSRLSAKATGAKRKLRVAWLILFSLVFWSTLFLLSGCQYLGSATRAEAQLLDTICDYTTERQRQEMGVETVHCGYRPYPEDPR